MDQLHFFPSLVTDLCLLFQSGQRSGTTMALALYNEELNSKALAHDIRGLLTTIQLAVDRLMLHEDRLVRTQCALVERVIVKATEYCSDAVCDSRKIKDESLSSNVLINDIDLILKPLANTHGVELKSVYTDFLIPTKISKKLQRIIINLCRNAIVAQKNQPSGTLLVLVDIENDDVCINIIDKGPGIPFEIMDELRQQFNSEKPRPKKALGMGLTSSYVYVEELGGEIYCVKSSITGTQFKIRIPISNKTKTKDSSPQEVFA